MADLIERYKITANLPSVLMNYCNRFNSKQLESITEMIYELENSIESADVQPVVHAYWIELPKALNPNENPCKCSNCGHVLSFMNYYPKSKYCDDCGARMDGDAE